MICQVAEGEPCREIFTISSQSQKLGFSDNLITVMPHIQLETKLLSVL